MESALDWHQAKALLDWYVELGVTDAIAEGPIDRYEAAVQAPKPVTQLVPSSGPAAAPEPDAPQTTDWVAVAKERAGAAASLEALADAMQGFEGSPLKRGARSFVFADGNPAARIMVVGEGPGAEEDREGRPFVGPAGRLLDQMFAAIGRSRTTPDTENVLYITNVVPWRPPGNRNPTPEEIAMFTPFLMRHIELADPDIVVPMGNIALTALMGLTGITRQRGQWGEVAGRPALPTFHPSFLLRNPISKREAWSDLLALQAKLREGP
ncbi:uracil-DNA glycosylase [Maritimibacter sp. UBA3975]|uniref:uracil-DNA glycosylase n=1 Tax=Maritimibacter sp. UBA3975 TaxID=1946833 RepID=UPI000C0A66B0|nr:uracil-DNA glycosylase [Maritimibacter sp. UBA3975]MAM62110.1 uracil-DNA glycosylase [Maritimibacter sp.]